MIKDDRRKLNERFAEAFRLLEERGDIVKNDRNGKGIGDVAERVLGKRDYGHIISAFLSPHSKRVIDYNQAQAFCRAYGINELWMLYGIGNPFSLDNPLSTSLQDSKYSAKRGNIWYTTVPAFAGATVGTEWPEDGDYFSIPGISSSGGRLVAFQIEGNSMDPVIKNGDIIVCREIEQISDIRDNEIYTVRSDGQLWVKYVQKQYNPAGRVTRLKLISANYFDHDPFEIDVNETTRLYKVIRKICAM
ncbi:MAG: S24 family peptidase [Saprospiraceae bacterium]|nr:S24 family peptidase [Saprospiraceae bacterium]MDW8228339.1 S24 family peptidase [Saprospiraceae bacterium]